ncbi:MAG: hypothetical protein RLY86_4341 [Pseudomonadota bacterium]|jgi:GTP:adenosylcobinamide-phosphate guanylyltransferase
MAVAAGVSHKAFLPVGGVPMIRRVVRALLASPVVGDLLVSIERPDLVQGDGELALLLESGRLRILPAAGSPARSVAATLQAVGTPLLATTADHALLDPAWVTHFWTHVPADADVAAALARREVVERDVPTTQRTWLRFADGQFSGCNLFAFRTPAAAGLVETWQQVEQDRKNPLKLITLLGPVAVAKFAMGGLTLTDALKRLEAITGAAGAIVEMPFGRAAVDVDKPADLTLAEQLLES